MFRRHRKASRDSEIGEVKQQLRRELLFFFPVEGGRRPFDT